MGKETENATFMSSIYTLDFVNSIYVVLHVEFKFSQRKEGLIIDVSLSNQISF